MTLVGVEAVPKVHVNSGKSFPLLRLHFSHLPHEENRNTHALR